MVSKRPTIIDVARRAGVSKATVGRVVGGSSAQVSPEKRDRVMTAATELGYVRNAAAGSLRTNRTGMVALSIPDISNPFFPEVVRGVQDTLERQGYSVFTANSEWDPQREARHLEMIRQYSFDGLIVSPTTGEVDYASLTSVPVVILGNGVGYPDYDSVGSDSQQGTLDALEHLYALGHRRIGVIIGGTTRKKTSSRQQSYIAFHFSKGMVVDEDLMIRCEFGLHTNGSFAAGKIAMDQLLSLPDRPTAVLGSNDILAIAALQAAQARGFNVPGDISVIGLDDILAASATSPTLTTITKPRYELGARAAQLLLENIARQDPEQPKHILLPCSLTTRDSTAAPSLKKDKCPNDRFCFV